MHVPSEAARFRKADHFPYETSAHLQVVRISEARRCDPSAVSLTIHIPFDKGQDSQSRLAFKIPGALIHPDDAVAQLPALLARTPRPSRLTKT
jgi:hypothetical protein